MAIIQCLLVAQLVVMIGGAVVLCSDLFTMHRNQAAFHAFISQYLLSKFGHPDDEEFGKVVADISQIAQFTRDARKGLISNLRYDDWYMTQADVDRWENARIMEAANSR